MGVIRPAIITRGGVSRFLRIYGQSRYTLESDTGATYPIPVTPSALPSPFPYIVDQPYTNYGNLESGIQYVSIAPASPVSDRQHGWFLFNVPLLAPTLYLDLAYFAQRINDTIGMTSFNVSGSVEFYVMVSTDWDADAINWSNEPSPTSDDIKISYTHSGVKSVDRQLQGAKVVVPSGFTAYGIHARGILSSAKGSVVASQSASSFFPLAVFTDKPDYTASEAILSRESYLDVPSGVYFTDFTLQDATLLQQGQPISVRGYDPDTDVNAAEYNLDFIVYDVAGLVVTVIRPDRFTEGVTTLDAAMKWDDPAKA